MAHSTPRPLPPRYHPLVLPSTPNNMCRQIVERYRFEACDHTRIKEGPIVGIKDCLRATCTKSRNHPYGCNAKSCRQKYERAIYPERPKSGYCNEKCEGRSGSDCVIA